MSNDSERIRNALLKAASQRDLDIIAKAKSKKRPVVEQKTRQESFHAGNAPFWDTENVLRCAAKLEAEEKEKKRIERNEKRRATRANKKLSVDNTKS